MKSANPYWQLQEVFDTAKGGSKLAKMKAICFDRYGPPDVFEYREIDQPVPKENEVLIRIRSTTVTPGDCEVRCFRFPIWIWVPLRIYMGLTKPKRPVLGMEFSGVVESIGSSVTNIKVGEEIFGGTGPRFGTYAEYRCQSADVPVGRKPEKVTHSDSATISVGGVNALHYLRLGKIKEGDKVLLIGAAGCFGTYAIQLAKHFGAEVTAVDSTDKIEIMKELGADQVIDFRKTDFTKTDSRYDLILDIAGKSSYSKNLRLLKPEGHLVLSNPKFLQMLRCPLTNLIGKKKVHFAFSTDRSEDLQYIADLIDSGVLKVVIDRKYPLENVADAHRHVDSGKKIGQVVIDIA